MKSPKDDMDRAEYLKHLYTEFLAKTDHKKDHKGRAKEAQSMMTERLGDAWKDDAEVEGMVFIEVEEPSKMNMQDRLDNYQDTVDKEGDKAGLGPAPEAKEADEDDSKMDVLKIIGKLLGLHDG